MKSTLSFIAIAALAASAHAAPAPSRQAPPGSGDLALGILKKSVSFPTFEGNRQVPAYAAYLAGLLKDAGFADGDIVIEPLGETATLVARYRGTGKGKPIIATGHMDVVPANRADGERDPFTAVVDNGMVFGRGALDNKFGVSTLIAAVVQLKREGFRPGRDIVLALSGDEETGMLTAKRMAEQLKDAELVLNGDAGGGQLDEGGKPIGYNIQAAEKTYVDYLVTITDPGGHSSRPGKTNAIAALASATQRIFAYRFPPEQNAITKTNFAEGAARRPGPIGDAMKRFAENPSDAEAAETLSGERALIGLVRTTCVPTMVTGGHAPNALPQRAVLTVNCRLFPGNTVEGVQARLAEVIADPAAKITVDGTPEATPASPLRPDVLKAVRRAIDLRYPGLPISVEMSTGATDSRRFRALGIPSYGIAGVFIKSEDIFAHGLNERVPVAALEGGVEQWRSLLIDLSR